VQKDDPWSIGQRGGLRDDLESMAGDAEVRHLDLSVALEMARIGRELVAPDLYVGAEEIHRGSAIIPVAVS
jgi:hypothetical protein